MSKTHSLVSVFAILALLTLLVLHHQDPQPQPAGTYSFTDFRQDFGKGYLRAGEEEYRKIIFLRNYVRIHEHNSDPENTWHMGVTQFADLTEAEFAATYLTLRVPRGNARHFK